MSQQLALVSPKPEPRARIDAHRTGRTLFLATNHRVAYVLIVQLGIRGVWCPEAGAWSCSVRYLGDIEAWCEAKNVALVIHPERRLSEMPWATAIPGRLRVLPTEREAGA